jgi:DNA polymerase I-like protein with 3'-5' exonuclease and polymerase domains
MQQIIRPFNPNERIVAIDIETESITDDPQDALNPFKNRITLIAVSDGDQLNRIFKSVHELDIWLASNILLMKDYRYTFHNAKFDIKNLIFHGLSKEIGLSLFNHDSNLLAFTWQNKIPQTWLDQYEIERVEINKKRKGMKLRKSGQHSLKTLAPYFLGVQPFWESEDGHNNEEYALKDASYTARLTRYFLENMDARSLDFYKFKFLPWTKMILEIELDGVRIDLDLLNKKQLYTDQRASEIHGELIRTWREHLKAFVIKEQDRIKLEWQSRLDNRKRPATEKQLAKSIESLNKQLANVEPFNFDSPAQLKWLLQDRLGLDVVNLEGDESTGKEVLTRLGEQDANVKKLLEFRKLRKLSSSFFPEYKRIAVNSKLYATFNVTSTRTGRLSSSEPNLQQVPGHLHDLFIPDEGNVFITKDLSAIEPTILAYYSEDPELVKMMQEGIRFHSVNAQAMFNLECELHDVKKLYPLEDKVAKTVGLAILYGAGANRVYQTMQQFGMMDYSLSDAKQIVYRIRDKYKGVWEFKQELDKVLESGEVVYNLLGRPFSIQDPQDAYMKALNTLIQSSASDLLVNGVRHILHQFGDILKPRLLVHDEVVFEGEKELAETFEQIIKDGLENTFTLNTQYGRIPIRTEGKVGNTWEK